MCRMEPMAGWSARHGNDERPKYLQATNLGAQIAAPVSTGVRWLAPEQWPLDGGSFGSSSHKRGVVAERWAARDGQRRRESEAREGNQLQASDAVAGGRC